MGRAAALGESDYTASWCDDDESVTQYAKREVSRDGYVVCAFVCERVSMDATTRHNHGAPPEWSAYMLCVLFVRLRVRRVRVR